MSFKWDSIKAAFGKGSKAAVGWLKGNFKTFVLGIAVVAVSGFIASALIYIIGSEKAKGRLLVLEHKYAQVEFTLKNNEKALAQCLAANAENALEAEKQKKKAEDAVLRLAEKAIVIARNEERIKHEAESFSNDLDCPSFSDEFSQWLWESTKSYH